jgi:type IV secretory pathway TraG/TraD family ATPase VirD4
VTSVSAGPAAASQLDGQGYVNVTILEGTTVQPAPAVAGCPFTGQPMRAILHGRSGTLRFDDTYLSKHVLFIGGIGTGKTNAMMQMLHDLRERTSEDDVFVVFDTKGDFLEEFYRAGDAVISTTPDAYPGGVIWNLFADLLDQDPAERSDHIFEIASTVFEEDLAKAEQNMFFAAAARDVFAGVVEALSRRPPPHDNAVLRAQLEGTSKALWDLMHEHADLAGAARYLVGQGNSPDSVRAFLQQTVNKSFSSVFRRSGDFSVRNFVRSKGGRGLFIEYDIAIGSRLLPIYRVLIDMAIKEALGLGRRGARGSVYFIFDEFALLPALSHIADGINFGRSLGLKFVAGTQNVDQVLHAYGPEVGRSIMSGFGTAFAFRLMDDASRTLVRQRFGANRKQIATFSPVRSHGVQHDVVLGSVVEDWALSGLNVGECIVSLPEGPPFSFIFDEYVRRAGPDTSSRRNG